MSGAVWTKFFWSDWRSDPKLRACSYAARGLWMEMLAIMAEAGGYLIVAGNKKVDAAVLARLTGGTPEEVQALLGELAENEVYSTDRRGIIYSRRMVGDHRRAATNRDNGKKGGNPILSKQKEISNSVIRESNPQSPESRVQTSLFPDGNSATEEKSAVMQEPPLDPEADYYRRGKEILGASAGGMLTQLIRAKGGNLALARAGLETASTRGDARQYIGAMIKNGGNHATNRNQSAGIERVGFAGIAHRLRYGDSIAGADRPPPEDLQPVNGR